MRQEAEPEAEPEAPGGISSGVGAIVATRESAGKNVWVMGCFSSFCDAVTGETEEEEEEGTKSSVYSSGTEKWAAQKPSQQQPRREWGRDTTCFAFETVKSSFAASSVISHPKNVSHMALYFKDSLFFFAKFQESCWGSIS